MVCRIRWRLITPRVVDSNPTVGKNFSYCNSRLLRGPCGLSKPMQIIKKKYNHDICLTNRVCYIMFASKKNPKLYSLQLVLFLDFTTPIVTFHASE